MTVSQYYCDSLRYSSIDFSQHGGIDCQNGKAVLILCLGWKRTPESTSGRRRRWEADVSFETDGALSGEE